jgi:hypothetical protein
MAMTEAERSSRSMMERTFYTKLGPTPAFPPSPTETEQVKPAQNAGLIGTLVFRPYGEAVR